MIPWIKLRKIAKKFRTYDFLLMSLVVLLIGIGLVMIYSSSSYLAQNSAMNDAAYFIKRQGVLSVAGIAGMLFVSLLDYHIYIKPLFHTKLNLLFLLYLLCFALLVYVAIFGEELNGAKRWIYITDSIGFQPSELTKVCVIMTTAYISYLAPKRLNHLKGFLRIFIFLAPLIGFVIAENLSTAIIIIACFVIICFVTSHKITYFIGSFFALVAAVAGYIFLSDDFRVDRVEIWLNVETHEKGGQILQGLYAIASGGLWGRGLGQSVQKLGYVPEAYNDMIFSIICEELGLVGATLIVLVYVLLLWRILVIACNAPDLFGSLIAVGVFAHIACQTLVNMAVVTNSIPSTGITLPFISYGVSSLVCLFGEMGIVLNISKQIGYNRQPQEIGSDAL